MDTILVVYWLVCDVFQVIKKYHDLELTEECLDDLVKDFSKITQKYTGYGKQTKILCRGLILAASDYFHERKVSGNG